MSEMTASQLQQTIDAAYDSSTTSNPELRATVETVIRALDEGRLKVIEKTDHGFLVHHWLKKAILLYFRQREISVVSAGDLTFVDKIPVKQWTGKEGVRVVPPAVVRQGAFISSGAILMPSYVNIGASVGSGTMVDTWATVGSCAYIGAGVHLSGGVGIGGVLEPIQARPVIIEDGVFVGSRAIIVEGVHVEARAVIGAGVTITASTKIVDVTGAEPVVTKGRIPKNSVVIPGTVPKIFSAGSFGVPCALIIGQRKESTDQKTSLTEALRDFDVAT